MSHAFAVTIGSVEHAVSLDLQGRCAIDGRETEAAVSSLGNGRYAVMLDGRPQVFGVRREGGMFILLHEGREIAVSVESERERAMRRVMPAQPPGTHKNEIVAPMPALVVRISVAKGDTVVEGQALLALEAMKMENEIKAPRAGRVREVRVQQGVAVEKGGILIVLE
jgi:biotin carboxyl carrier protein